MKGEDWAIIISVVLVILFIVGMVLLGLGADRNARQDCRKKCNMMDYTYWDIYDMNSCECLTKNKERVVIKR